MNTIRHEIQLLASKIHGDFLDKGEKILLGKLGYNFSYNLSDDLRHELIDEIWNKLFRELENG